MKTYKIKINMDDIHIPYYYIPTADILDDTIVIDNYNKKNKTNHSYSDFDYTYDDDLFFEDIYNIRIKLLQYNIIDDVILKIEGYNYTVDYNRMLDYINKNKKDYKQYIEYINYKEKKELSTVTGREKETMLRYYLNRQSRLVYSFEDYIAGIYEAVNPQNYIQVKLINK